MSKKYRFVADAVFDAEDINDAFQLIAEYFQSLYEIKIDGKPLEFAGKIYITAEEKNG